MLGVMDPWNISKFVKKDFIMIKKHNELIKEQDLLKKIQAFISFDFKFKFFLSSWMCFSCYHFSHAIIVVMFFSWCISSIGTKDQILTLCYNVRHFFTLQLF
jgi:hypothetical protein